LFFFFCISENENLKLIIPTFLQQLIIVDFFTCFHASIMFSVSCFGLIGVNYLSSSTHSNISLTMSFLYFLLSTRIMPWSRGWMTDVQLGSKKCTFTLVKWIWKFNRSIVTSSIYNVSICNKTKAFHKKFQNCKKNI